MRTKLGYVKIWAIPTMLVVGLVIMFWAMASPGVVVPTYRDHLAVWQDGTKDLTGDWTVSANSITLTLGTLKAEHLTSTDDANVVGTFTAGTLTDGTASVTGGAGTGFTQLVVDTLTLDANSITGSDGTIYFGDENLVTTGTFTTEDVNSTDDGTIADNLYVGGTLNLGADDDIAHLYVHDAGTAVFYDDSDDTSVTVGPVGDGTTTLGVTGGLDVSGNVDAGTATLASGSLTDSSGAISFNDENLSTTGTFVAEDVNSTDDGAINGILYVGETLNLGADDDIANANIHDAGVLTMYDDSDDTSVVVGPVADGTTTLGITGGLDVSGNVDAGTMTVASGSLTDSSGAISFNDENLSTTGTFVAEDVNSTDDGAINGILYVGETLNLGADDDIANANVHHAGVVTMYDASDDTSVAIGPVADGTTDLGITGSILVSGTVQGEQLTSTDDATINDDLQANDIGIGVAPAANCRLKIQGAADDLYGLYIDQDTVDLDWTQVTTPKGFYLDMKATGTSGSESAAGGTMHISSTSDIYNGEVSGTGRGWSGMYLDMAPSTTINASGGAGTLGITTKAFSTFTSSSVDISSTEDGNYQVTNTAFDGTISPSVTINDAGSTVECYQYGLYGSVSCANNTETAGTMNAYNYGVFVDVDGETYTNGDATSYGVYISCDDDVENSYALYVSDEGSSNTAWSIYSASSADNALAGNVRIGSTTAPTVALDVTGDTNLDGKVSLTTPSELTISVGGAITVTQSYHKVDTNADGATDDLDTISGGVDGMVVVLRAENDARDVVVKDGTGNIACGGDRTLDSYEDTITLIYDSGLSKWLETAFANNG